jgi:hypothetical protein
MERCGDQHAGKEQEEKSDDMPWISKKLPSTNRRLYAGSK